MMLPIEQLLLLCAAFFVVSALYASVGFGGGSSYLALLALFVGSFFAIRSIALICNLVVVSGSTYLYIKGGHAKWRHFLPFVLTSVPLAFLGATFRLKEQMFFIVLGLALIGSALSLFWQTFASAQADRVRPYPRTLPYVLGTGIGFLSGLVGIGGGIFLAPVLNHLKWGRAVVIAALASFFILVNSLAGLGGLVWAGTLELPWVETACLAVTVFVGGQLGVRISLKRFSATAIKRITAILVLLVGLRVLLVHGLQWF
ncbi:sulfite exporter TauE/SafE family protein [Maribacter sp. 2307ULW6-5]|uniref:sulfite exporter TauE/SafE family protein n=1 Tax=Maribacter sp. 2307ULW6-5 TaxID=3386275 RepID=UPI0039BCCD50